MKEINEENIKEAKEILTSMKGNLGILKKLGKQVAGK